MLTFRYFDNQYQFQHRTNIVHPTSNIQHRTSNIELHQTSYIKHPTSYIVLHRTSNPAHKLKTLFLTLRTFSATGGIEKVCRIMGKALYEESLQNDGLLQVGSMYDKQHDAFNNPYFPAENFLGFSINKIRFTAKMVLTGSRNNRVILSHINLLRIGSLIKRISPRTRLILLAHGIEVWKPLSRRKRKWMKQCDTILAVSAFTKNKIIEQHGVSQEKCIVLNNCLDPFLPLPSAREKSVSLLNRYNFSNNDIIIMTLTRLRSNERYKGYDKVIEAIAFLKAKYPQIKYLLAGSYDDKEKEWVGNLIQQAGLEHLVMLPGYIEDNEIRDHFNLSDIYMMPSRGEGFGIVFIEAMYYGLPVIAGNEDGSVDALLNGALGQLVNPGNAGEIATAITNVVENPSSFTPNRKLLLNNFSYETYKENLNKAIAH